MSRLGRGLKSLIQDIESPTTGSISSVKIEYIKPNRYQPRRVFDDDKLRELSESIKENGLIQPIVVGEHSPTEYELVAGERRLLACKMAGLTEVPVYIKNVTDKELSAAIKNLVEQKPSSHSFAAKKLNIKKMYRIGG